MSSKISMSMTNEDQYIIQLSVPFETLLCEESLFQRENYKRLYEKLSDVKEQFDIIRNNTSGGLTKISTSRSNITFFVAGARGSGKSVFLKNISPEKVHGYEILDIIDPTLLDGTMGAQSTEAFCAVLIAHFHQHISAILSNGRENDCDEYYNKFREVAEALGSMQDGRDDNGIDAIYANQNALHLEQLLHEYFMMASSKYLDNKIICFRIDDVDMVFANGFFVLEAIRKYLSSPYVIIIVTGDPKLYQALVWHKMLKELSVPNNKYENEFDITDNKRFLMDLSVQYLNKVMPRDYRLSLLEFSNFLDIYSSSICFRVADENIELVKIETFLNELINPGIHQEEFKCFYLLSTVTWKGSSSGIFLRDNLRLWMHFHKSLLPLYRQSKELFSSIDSFKLKITNKIHYSLYRDFQSILFNFFNSLPQFNLIYEMSRINLMALANRPLQYDVGIALQELSRSEKLAIGSEDASLDDHKKLGKILKITTKETSKSSLASQDSNPIIKLLLHLFIVNTFAYNGKNETYVYSGRFVEFLFSTLTKIIDKNQILDIIYHKPLFSIIGESIQKLDVIFDTSSKTPLSETDLNSSPDPILEAIFSEDFEMDKKLEYAWEELFNKSDDNSPKDASFFDISLLKSSLGKFVYEMRLYRNKFPKGETLAHYMVRCVYILLNAIACCEQEKPICRYSIAISPEKSSNAASQFDVSGKEISFRERIENHSQAFTRNIKPLLVNKVSLVYRIYHHPVVQAILSSELFGQFMFFTINCSNDETSKNTKKGNPRI